MNKVWIRATVEDWTSRDVVEVTAECVIGKWKACHLAVTTEGGMLYPLNEGGQVTRPNAPKWEWKWNEVSDETSKLRVVGGTIYGVALRLPKSKRKSLSIRIFTESHPLASNIQSLLPKAPRDGGASDLQTQCDLKATCNSQPSYDLPSDPKKDPKLFFCGEKNMFVDWSKSNHSIFEAINQGPIKTSFEVACSSEGLMGIQGQGTGTGFLKYPRKPTLGSRLAGSFEGTKTKTVVISTGKLSDDLCKLVDTRLENLMSETSNQSRRQLILMENKRPSVRTKNVLVGANLGVSIDSIIKAVKEVKDVHAVVDHRLNKMDLNSLSLVVTPSVGVEPKQHSTPLSSQQDFHIDSSVTGGVTMILLLTEGKPTRVFQYNDTEFRLRAAQSSLSSNTEHMGQADHVVDAKSVSFATSCVDKMRQNLGFPESTLAVLDFVNEMALMKIDDEDFQQLLQLDRLGMLFDAGATSACLRDVLAGDKSTLAALDRYPLPGGCFGDETVERGTVISFPSETVHAAPKGDERRRVMLLSTWSPVNARANKSPSQWFIPSAVARFALCIIKGGLESSQEKKAIVINFLLEGVLSSLELVQKCNRTHVFSTVKSQLDGLDGPGRALCAFVAKAEFATSTHERKHLIDQCCEKLVNGRQQFLK